MAHNHLGGLGCLAVDQVSKKKMTRVAGSWVGSGLGCLLGVGKNRMSLAGQKPRSLLLVVEYLAEVEHLARSLVAPVGNPLLGSKVVVGF